jgi:hypothetical protein
MGKEILPLVTPRVMKWETQDWSNPVAWEKR